MGQELIALNGNEQFPYQLKPNDIANAMGLPNGIAPGGYNSDGAITTTSIANSSGEVLLEDNAWNNVVEVSGETTSITLPSSDPTNAIINFYPKTPPSSDPNSTWSLEANSGQYLYSPTTGITGNTTTSIDVPYTNSLTVLSRGNGEIDIIGGTYLITNNIAPKIANPLTVPKAINSGNTINLSQLFIGNRKAVFTSNGNWTVPEFVSTIWVSGVGGGGGGGGGAGGASGGNGGSAGENYLKYPISVTPGHVLTIDIGAEGSNGGTSNTSGSNGGNTVLTDSTAGTTLLTIYGGSGGNNGGNGSGTSNGGKGANSYVNGCLPGGNQWIIDGVSIGGQGASSIFGGGGAASLGTGNGSSQNASGYGAGGGGGSGGGAGGNGTPGILIIEW